MPTPDQINAMPPGPDMDDLIAEHVFGRDPFNARRGVGPFPDRPQFHWGYPVGHDFAPAYSTDPTLMWRVIDAVVEGSADTIIFKLSCLYPGSGDEPHIECRLGAAWANGNPPVVAAGSSPEAVCKAALLFKLSNPATAKG